MKQATLFTIYAIVGCIRTANGDFWSWGQPQSAGQTKDVLRNEFLKEYGAQDFHLLTGCCHGKRDLMEEFQTLEDVCWACQDFVGAGERKMFKSCLDNCYDNNYFFACAELLDFNRGHRENLNMTMAKVKCPALKPAGFWEDGIPSFIDIWRLSEVAAGQLCHQKMLTRAYLPTRMHHQ